MKILQVLTLAGIVALSACAGDAGTAKTEVKNQATKIATKAQPATPGKSLPVSKRTPAQQLEADKKLIADYVENNGLKGSYTDSGIFYSIEKQGSGANPTKQNTEKRW